MPMPETFEEEEPPVKDEPQKPTIPHSKIMAFIEEVHGKVDNLFKVDCHSVRKNYFRINVWESKMGEERVVPLNRIVLSYYVMYNSSGVIIDATIRKAADVNLH
jgi:hypothetical protein